MLPEGTQQRMVFAVHITACMEQSNAAAVCDWEGRGARDRQYCVKMFCAVCEKGTRLIAGLASFYFIIALTLHPMCTGDEEHVWVIGVTPERIWRLAELLSMQDRQGGVYCNSMIPRTRPWNHMAPKRPRRTVWRYGYGRTG